MVKRLWRNKMKKKNDALLNAIMKDPYSKSWDLKRKVRKKTKKNAVMVEGKAFTMKDLQSFFVQSRGFPTMLHIGDVYGEGQSGGRRVSDVAHAVENKFVEKYGVEGYRKKMDKLMGKTK